MRLRLLAMISTGLLTAACGAAPTGIDGEWRLVEGTLGGEQILTETRPGDMRPGSRGVTLVIEGNEVSGQGPCNMYGGLIEVNAREGSGFAPSELAVEWGDVFANLASCGDAVDAIERVYFEALLQSDRSRRAGDIMILRGDEARLVFELDQ
jgi:hypothetical protein